MAHQSGEGFIGKRVLHYLFGQGVVEAVFHSGASLRVRFDSGLRIPVPRNKLTYLDPIGPFRVPEAVEKPARETEPPKERTMIEAFRLGIVPQAYVREFTYGRDEEIRRLEQWLDGPDNTLVIKGPYGVGKTHLLDFLYYLALEKGFAVARASLNPADTPPHKPKRVYHQLMTSFRYRRQDGTEGDFRQFLRDLAETDSELSSHKYFRYVLRAIRNEHRLKEDLDLWFQWIEGSSSFSRTQRRFYLRYVLDDLYDFPTLYDHNTAANIYCNLLSALGYAAVQDIGLKGFILLLDEAESLVDLNRPQFDYAVNFLNGLLLISDNELNIIDTHLLYSRRDLETNYIYKYHRFLKSVYVFTSDASNYIFNLNKEYKYSMLTQKFNLRSSLLLEPVILQEVKGLWVRLFEMYARAYETAPLSDEEKGRALATVLVRIMRYGHETSDQIDPRFLVKGLVEYLDLLRLNGEPPDIRGPAPA